MSFDEVEKWGSRRETSPPWAITRSRFTVVWAAAAPDAVSLECLRPHRLARPFRPGRLVVPDRDLCFTPATTLARLYRARKVSPLEVVQAVLARIDALNPVLGAYVTVARDQALGAARKATAALRRGAPLPPLHGIPVSIKDVTPTKGLRTTWGSKIYEHHVPAEDALIVERLKAAGAVVVGKTNTPEFAAGGNTFNAILCVTRNPWNPALTVGGSSGGAAVGAGAGNGPPG